MTQIPERLYFRIGDVAEISGVKPHVLRYWETEFPLIAPEKSGSGQRVYRRHHIETVLLIKHLLYQERYSIEGARRKIRELRKQGELKNVREEQAASSSSLDEDPMPRAERLKRIKGLVNELRGLLARSEEEEMGGGGL